VRPVSSFADPFSVLNTASAFGVLDTVFGFAGGTLCFALIKAQTEPLSASMVLRSAAWVNGWAANCGSPSTALAV
jgi:hypothetical protein